MNSRLLVLILFFLSGACGLVYEVVWARELSLIFGVTIFATSTVLAAYMGGLALGSFLVGRFIDRSPNPLRVYAVLEVGIGLLALLTPLAFSFARSVYVPVANALEGHFLLFNLVRVLILFLILMVPTTLMGGTVPAIGRFLVERKESVGWNVGLLYALNTFGAVLGVLLTGFVLIPELGLTLTTRLAAAGNVSIGLVLLLWGIGKMAPHRRPVAASLPLASDLSASSAQRRRLVVLVMMVFAISGFAALAYEVVWTRVLVIHVFNTSYAFSLMLAVFLAGLVLGDVLLIRIYDRIEKPVLWLGIVQVGIGISVVGAAAAYIRLGSVGFELLGVTSSESFGQSLTLMLLRAALVMFPFTILLGMTFPLVARCVCDDDDSVGRSLGNIYAANTCGSILGSVGAAFVLIPLLGLRNSLLALSALNVILGALCLWAELASSRRRIAAGVLVAAGLILPSLMIPKTIFFDALEPDTGKLVYYKEGITDTTSVLEWRPGARLLLYGDGRGTAGTMTDRLNRTLGHLAHLLHPNPRHSLQIGFGVGNTLAAAALHPEVEQLDCAELSSHVRETATYFWTNQGVLDDPKVNLIVDDGRNYVSRTRTRYEVITLEPPNIYTASVVNLYTREFYELASEAMTDDGILMQWIAVGDVNDAELEQLVRAMVDVFPHVTLWDEGPMAFFKAPTGYLLVVGSKQPLRIDVGELERRMNAPEIRDDLQRIGLESPAKLLSLFIAGDQGARRWTADAVAVTDDKTVVDYSTAKSIQSGFGLGFFHLEGDARHRWFRRFTEISRLYQGMREPVDPLLVNVSDPEKLRAEIQAYHAVFDRSVDEWEVARGANAPNP